MLSTLTLFVSNSVGSEFLLNWLTCFIMLDLSKNKEQMVPGLMRYLSALGLKVLFLIPITQ